MFELGLHLNWAMPTSLPTSVVYIQHRINSLLSRKLHFLPPMSGGLFSFFENYPGAHLGDFEYYKGRKCKFRDSMKFIGCCMLTIDASREVDMAQLKCKLSSNIGQDFLNHFMSL